MEYGNSMGSFLPSFWSYQNILRKYLLKFIHHNYHNNNNNFHG